MMKVTFETWETKHFDDLQTGDVFTYNGDVFMKTSQPEDTQPNRAKAVKLSTGEMFHFGANINVHPVESELIVS